MECRHNHIIASSTDISAAASQRISILGGCCVEVIPLTQGVWAKLGDDTVAATAGTAGETPIPAGPTPPAHFCRSGSKNFDTGKHKNSDIALIQMAATADGVVNVLG